MKLVLGLLESYYVPLSNDVPFLYFWEFRFFGHVTGDVIIWSRDQIWEKNLDQNICGHNLGNVTKHHSERCSRFGYMAQFIVPRAY